eukprot:Gb_04725 [translate_table: standard]
MASIPCSYHPRILQGEVAAVTVIAGRYGLQEENAISGSVSSQVAVTPSLLETGDNTERPLRPCLTALHFLIGIYVLCFFFPFLNNTVTPVLTYSRPGHECAKENPCNLRPMYAADDVASKWLEVKSPEGCPTA